MIAEPQEEGLFSSEQVREYIGSMFREKVRNFIPSWYSNQGNNYRYSEMIVEGIEFLPV